MTKQDWDTLQEEYDSSVFASINIKVGSFKITLQKQIGKKKVFNMVFVNGSFFGGWLNEKYSGSEKEFMYRTTRTIRTRSDKDLRKLKRTCGSDFAKIFEPVKIYLLLPFYPSFTAFKKRMIATGLLLSPISE